LFKSGEFSGSDKVVKSKLSPFLWSGLVMVLALALALYVASLEKPFFAANQFTSPNYSLGPIIAYFFGVVVLIALVLFIIPLSRLRLVFRVLFALMFGWGVFIVTYLVMPLPAAYAAAVVAGLAWLFWDRVWLHDLLLLVALAGAASVFGFLFSPLTFMIFMLLIAVYDVLAVRFGFMVWMADKLSQSDTLPAFVFPRQVRDWRMRLRSVRVGDLKKEAPDKREYSVLGGGDIGFPLMLSVSVFFAADLVSAVLVGVFALAGVMVAFLIQLFWLRGRPMPALPPIAFLSLIGFLITRFYFS
jgi:presenilin-like A22 family membrane protease